ncbi:MAG: FkbM family methyltransferase [candidate division SR1 bacterium]|nr:FkbM family methyltransferase [candidate division SR1 bacterium]
MGFTSIYFKNIFRESHIYAFEPDMKAFHILEKNIKYRNLKDISIFNVAVTDKKGEIDFFTNETVGLQMSINEKRSNVKKTTVNTISLSEFIKNNNLHIDILKIDIEGAETIVFRDLYKNNCLNKINEILIEYHHNIEESPNHLSEFLQMIENSGFDYQISSNYLNKNKPKEFQDISIHAYKKI